MVCRVFSDRYPSLVGVGRGRVNVVYGPHDLDMPLAGLTVEEIQLSLRDVLGVGRNAEAFHNNILIEDNGRIVTGGRLEFIKRWGRKRTVRPDWESPDGRIQLFCGDCGLILPQLNHCQ